ncbi:lipopolysaccharide biosynthesis protein [Petrimonas sulfuriphila]|uniref:lipopolysaccharide biosynthesis protein n=1 Tax=Petrimonas sulfuriphila TaxID=285070 RepID=UPI003EBA9500
MSKNLRSRTVSGLFWSFIDSFAVQGIGFVVGIILARILDPSDFGLIGMMTIFISISQWFVSSGFGQALIRKQDCTQDDYSTVFLFNIIFGGILYIVLFASASFIAHFFNEPQLTPLIKVLGFSILITALTIVQRTQLTKKIAFKLQTRISVVASVTAGVVAIIMAYYNWGVWSLIVKTLIENGINSVLLWLYSKWRPSLIFSKRAFNELFGFGYKLMLRGLIYTIFNNIYYAIIGKYFSAAQLGYYTRAEQFSNLPSTKINKIVNRVSYPALSELQEDTVKLKHVYRKILISLVYITSICMIILAALAEPVVIILVGEKWRPSIEYLQLLSIIGLLYPLCDYNLTILKIVNQPSIILKLEIFKRLFSIPIIVIGVILGIKELLVGIIILTWVEFFVNSYFSGKYIAYSIPELLQDILPNISLAVVVGTGIWIYVQLSVVGNIYYLLLGLFIAMILIIVLSEIFRVKGYLYIKEVLIKELINKKKR